MLVRKRHERYTRRTEMENEEIAIEDVGSWSSPQAFEDDYRWVSYLNLWFESTMFSLKEFLRKKELMLKSGQFNQETSNIINNLSEYLHKKDQLLITSNKRIDFLSFEWNKSKQKVLALKSKIDKMENEIDKMENELNKNILDIMALNLQNAYLIEENKKLSKMDEDNFQQIKNLLIQVDYLVGVVRKSPKDPEEF
ncbi:24784_t:CDS:2 [Gigaspora margarita]|uniref:24784_t:CDS:1 n=1 Tax=Gigaspora margarita TaxID=4874 RepID=A0ABN7V4X7_GIGMA|nr:24784_t:CDS:2 [Gigaspora margarita]